MSDVHWIKLAVDTFTDEKIRLIEALPQGDTLLVVWLKLLTLAGKTNDDGFIYVSANLPYTPDRLSIVLNRPVKIVQTALKLFTDMGMIEQNGKGIHITNWTKHQNAEKLDRMRERTRARVAKHRSATCNAVCNADVTLGEPLHVTPCNAVEVEVESRVENRDRVEGEPPPATTTGTDWAKAHMDSMNPWYMTAQNLRRKLKAHAGSSTVWLANKLRETYADIYTPEQINAQIDELALKGRTGVVYWQLFCDGNGSRRGVFDQAEESRLAMAMIEAMEAEG